MTKDNKFNIRPAGRHIIAIGAGLIKDQYTALVELVKNSFDADAKKVEINFSSNYDDKGDVNGITIEVIDDGHGMSFDTVTGVWMTPSTSDKLLRKTSPKGRVLQGRKGIGRYAVSMLGNELILDTVDKGKIQTITYINWDEFEKSDFLDEVYIEINKSKTEKKPGTKILIQGSLEYSNSWTEKEIRNLIFELKKLSPPTDSKKSKKDVFDIRLKFHKDFHLSRYAGEVIKIDPFSVFKNFHYRIWGTINEFGNAQLYFVNSRISNKTEKINVKINISKENYYPGMVSVDFRVYDRDSNSIQYLIDKGLRIPISGDKIGKREARRVLDLYNGIGVYRNDFRIRPLGDSGFDWLNLDKNRIQDPSRRIGSDQVIGFVHIQSEEKSGLEEKTARDGLRENKEYFGLVDICKEVLLLLEQRRFIYRKSVGLSRSKKDLNSKINRLFEFDELKNDINVIFDKLNIDDSTKDEIFKLIDKEQETKNDLVEEIQKIIAIYQGQATVGKIVDILLHEGRRSLNYFKNEAPRLRKKVKVLEKSSDIANPKNKKIIDYITKTSGTIEEQTNQLAELFAKVDPLASRRTKRKNFNLKKCVDNSFSIFESELLKSSINVSINIPSDIIVYGWKADFSATFVNLIDNSIYWLNSSSQRKKDIIINTSETEEELIITFKDNGPGIPEDLIESQIIFEPDFSTKSEKGKGLGLAIAGESISRNNGRLIAEYPEEEGAYFKIIVNKSNNE